ncbi:HNH endonuclease [Mycolicibacterium sp. 018/SC-01/001]|uniref:HNH endonuclease signature motif containing protein n=1 Tax=Mycolicibacterium sp. 018/SC-01/001 TaxID=2592069 RepID=UPI00117CB8AB|nr:HNH endonuclease signature motif containing protein [Mycolicibacterium sp. 018/SC-01/001]TRW83292.1 HNH endonuclease [Mycolicibacterium sp. 018/SC-01/001]
MFEDNTASLIDTMAEAARAESAAIARRLGAVALLYQRRCRDYEEAQFWFTDVFEAVSAEVSAAQNISRDRAIHQVRQAVSLYERLPEVAAVFARGEIDYRMVQIIITRTDNVLDAVVGELDRSLAAQVHKWMRLSKPKLRDRIDVWVAEHDPAGVRVPPVVEDNRYIEVEPHPNAAGMAVLGGVLGAADADAIDQRLNLIADSVCVNDPRSKQQRRADAAGALGRLEGSLACQCGSQDCTATKVRESAAQVVIHVLAEQKTLEGASPRPGYLSGFGVLPAESVQKLTKTAKIKPVRLPGADAERAYRPSAALRDFLQWRDLTCRFPGCDRPVAGCDVDHTTPWPFGLTHPSGLKHFCRTHHLIKTFYTGANGWADEQKPDGSVVLRSPTGHVYTTEAFGGVLFPGLAAPTATITTATPTESSDCSAMMPKRKTTREQDRRRRIRRERQQRIELDAELERQRQARFAANEPPPF